MKKRMNSQSAGVQPLDLGKSNSGCDRGKRRKRKKHSHHQLQRMMLDEEHKDDGNGNGMRASGTVKEATICKSAREKGYAKEKYAKLNN
jgi:hypothetical protein